MSTRRPDEAVALRWLTLLPITAASLITMMAETLPAGLLPQLSRGVHASTSVTGQAVSVYALGSMLAALPLVALTRSRPQRPVLVAAIAVVGAATLAAAASGNVAVLLLARVVAGVAAGLLWALAAHYAMAISPEGAQAKALSIAMLGVPLGMAIGTPLGTFAGQHLGWRTLMSALGIAGLATAGWACVTLPPLPGKNTSAADSVSRRWGVPLLALMGAAFAFEVGHMASYTYASALASRGDRMNPGAFLLIIGLSAVIGLILSGRFLDKSPLHFFCLDLIALGVAFVALWGCGTSLIGAVVAAILWGLALGPATTLAQACAAQLAPGNADLVQGVLVTVLNAGMACGAAAGGWALGASTTARLPMISAAILGLSACASFITAHRNNPL